MSQIQLIILIYHVSRFFNLFYCFLLSGYARIEEEDYIWRFFLGWRADSGNYLGFSSNKRTICMLFRIFAYICE